MISKNELYDFCFGLPKKVDFYHKVNYFELLIIVLIVILSIKDNMKINS